MLDGRVLLEERSSPKTDSACLWVGVSAPFPRGTHYSLLSCVWAGWQTCVPGLSLWKMEFVSLVSIESSDVGYPPWELLLGPT